MGSCTIESQVGEDFPHNACKFVAMTAEAGCEGDSVMFRVFAYDEMLVRAVGVQAGAGSDYAACRAGNICGQDLL